MTTARLKALAIVTVTLSAAALSAGCNLEPSAVDKPTYEADVRPIFMARCIRCHGYPVLADPTTAIPIPPPPNERFDVYGDTNCAGDAGVSCVHGALYVATVPPAPMDKFTNVLVTLAGKPGGMPPAPAPQLTTYQRDTILKWANESPPLEK